MNLNIFVEKLFNEGRKKGFSDMEVYYINADNLTITVFEKDVDTYNVNTEIGLSFRGIISGKMGYAYTERFDEEDTTFLLESAAQNAMETECDEEPVIYAGDSANASIPMSCDMEDINAGETIKDALNMEKTAMEVDERIKSVEYCIVETSKVTKRIINTKGLNIEDKHSLALGYTSVVAKDGDDVKSGDYFKVSSKYKDIDFNMIAKKAAKEALAYLGAKSINTGGYRTILRWDAAASLLQTFSSIFSGEEAIKGLSLLNNRIGEKIASTEITIVDDPLFKDAPVKYNFDDEGVTAFKKDVIKNGVLENLLYDLKTAVKAGVKPTGNGFKASYKSPVKTSPTNMCILPGKRSLEEVVQGMDKCVIITGLQGLHSGANQVSGDFSLGANGYLVENGKIIMPVEQITVAGNFYKMLLDIEEVLTDFGFGMSSGAGLFGSPSLLIREMSISGK